MPLSCYRLSEKSPIFGWHVFDLGGSNSECILAPWFNPYLLIVITKDELAVLDVQHLASEGFRERDQALRM